MPGKESESDLKPLLPELLGIQERIRTLEARKLALEEQILLGLFGSPSGMVEEQAANGDQQPAPRRAQHMETKQAAIRLADTLADALMRYSMTVEDHIFSESDKVHEELSSSRRLMDSLAERLDRHTDALRSVGEAQGQQAAVLRQLLEVLMRSG